MTTHYTRGDLAHLKTLTKHEVYKALRSFDGSQMDQDAFGRHLGELLDPERVSGLPGCMGRADGAGVIQALYDACLALASEQPASIASATAEQIQAADEAMAHRFTFYGETHQLPESIDWDFNPGTGHWGHDLNRFTYLHPLVAAYFATGDERYARKAVGLILDWIAKADFAKMFVGTKYVFGSYLNHALHVSVWARCIGALLPKGTVGPGELAIIIKAFHDHCAYLEIVTAGHAGNWPTIGMRGLLPTIAYFPVLRDTERFADYAIKLMHDQIADQVLPDGVQDELTSHYHSVVISNLFDCISALAKLGKTLDGDTLDTLGKMLRYWQAVVTPSGKSQVGTNDSDPTVVAKHWDTAKSLGLGHFLDDPGLIGPSLYPYAGMAFLRQIASEGDLYLAFDMGPFGRSHQHEDKLAIMVHAYGRDLLVDPGRHLYDNSEKSFRAHLTDTRAHSTIMVDGLSQNSRAHRDLFISRKPCAVAWSTTPALTRAQGSYDLGYGAQGQVKAVHKREVAFVGQRFWLVFDRVEGEGEHTIDMRFQYPPGDVVAGRIGDGARGVTQFGDANLLLIARPSARFERVEVLKGQLNPREGWYSPVYGQLEPAPTLALSVRAKMPFECVTLLWPSKDAGAEDVSLELTTDAAIVSQGDATWGVTLPKWM